MALWVAAAGTAVAQNDVEGADDAFQKLPDGVEESVYRVRVPGEGEFRGARVSPPSWFVDLPRREVEVLLYDEGIGAHDVRLEGAGARLLRAEPLPNDNYVLATVLVDEGAEPGELTFVSADGRRYPWRLDRAKAPRPLSPADLVYLIMPDRFANGDPGNDDLAAMAQRGTARDKVFFRHGGDLAGVTRQLDYIAGLGATTLWLNPVLENDQPYESYHGYAVTDHYRIDRRLGTLADYQRLVDEAHRRGLKVLMDIVPNHAGDEHYLYADMPAADWFHQPDTFTRSNFRIPSVLDPHAVASDRQQLLDGWFDRHMPDFDQANPHVRRYFEQVALWWIGHTGHDGYRVDTYPYSDPEFMAEWSETIRANFPTVSFFGEVWVDGLPNQASFVPGFEGPVPVGANPSVTDFQLKDALYDALHNEQSWAGGVARLWLTLTQDYLYEDPNALVTFVDNHDLTRVATALGGDQARLESAITLLLTLRGTPMLYYGTELGLEGSGGGFGEGGRKDMPGGWAGDVASAFTGVGLTARQRRTLEHVRAVGQYRKANPGLATGTMRHWVPTDGRYAFARTSPDGARTWLVVYNGSDAAQTVALDRYLTDLDAGRRVRRVIGADDAGDNLADRANPVQLGARATVVFEVTQ